MSPAFFLRFLSILLSDSSPDVQNLMLSPTSWVSGWGSFAGLPCYKSAQPKWQQQIAFIDVVKLKRRLRKQALLILVLLLP